MVKIRHILQQYICCWKVGLYVMQWWCPAQLTHWGRVTHICVRNLTIIGSDNGLSPGRRQAIIWTNAGILLIGPLGTNFSEILIEIHIFSIWCNHYYLILLFIDVLDLGFVCQVTSRHILFWMVYCGIKDMRIVWFLRLVNVSQSVRNSTAYNFNSLRPSNAHMRQ